MKGSLGVLILLWGFGPQLLAASNLIQRPKSCSQLALELENMQSAQRHILKSFIRKNEMMSMVLEQNAETIQAKIEQSQPIKRSDLNPLKNSAMAYRGHQTREANLIGKFESASSRLIDEVQKCLINSNNE
jgi:hypothetical protein